MRRKWIREEAGGRRRKGEKVGNIEEWKGKKRNFLLRSLKH